MYSDGPGPGTVIVFIVACAFFFLMGLIAASDSPSKSSALQTKYNQLTLAYETLQCSHRGLALTTVKGITLCMNPETKALHKIDEKAD